MEANEITTEHFEALRAQYGSHSGAARALGTTPTHYSFVRKSGRMSGPLRALILSLYSHCQDSLPTPAQPQDGAA